MATRRQGLTLVRLQTAAREFAARESGRGDERLFGVTDGKKIGTYLELEFQTFLQSKHQFSMGNAAKGIDLPELNVDLKTTSITQPQSSCPFRSARQKIFGLGYSLLVFVYSKTDDAIARKGMLKILHVIFVEASQTGDYQMTRGLREMLARDANLDDIQAFLQDRNLPVDEIELRRIAEEVLATCPEQGYLTISNALQWRLQYSRVIDLAGQTPGIRKVM